MAKTKVDKAAALLEITQVRSGIRRPAKQRATLKALGLRRHQQTVTQPDNAAIRGMIFRVRHLVDVRAIDDAGAED